MTKSDAVEYFGSQSAVAGVLGISRMAISGWGDTIPEQRQAQLQIISNGDLVADMPKPTDSKVAGKGRVK